MRAASRRSTRPPPRAAVVFLACLALLIGACGARDAGRGAARALAPGVLAAPRPVPPPALHADGTRLVTADGAVVRPLGVTRSGTEYACIQGTGIFEGPVDDAAIAAMRDWGINTVRVPLNEDCWLALGGVDARYAGANYQRAIADYVARLNAVGLYAILDLHWSGGGDLRATKLRPMPDRDHGPAFWGQVAAAYRDSPGVLFEPFNEPFPDGDRETPAAWRCWRDGGTCPGVPYTAAGMQELVTAIRDTGAPNLILLGGVRYANALGGWAASLPDDPRHNLAASWHVYDYSECRDRACYDRTVGAILDAGFPVVAGEIGETDCAGRFVEPLMNWLDGRGQGYVAWAWNVEGTCADGPQLIRDYAGTPTGYGQAFRDHLARVAAPPAPAPCDGRRFPETGYCLGGRFRAYWEAHGGLARNGYPLSDPFAERLEDGRGYTVQYCERVRLEYHPENVSPDDVLLGQFGRRFHPADPPVDPQAGAAFFAPTGHNVPPDFLAYWSGNGGLAQFGYPLSEEFVETLEDGRPYTVQYFERARFERHPEIADPGGRVLLGQFGRRILADHRR